MLHVMLEAVVLSATVAAAAAAGTLEAINIHTQQASHAIIDQRCCCRPTRAGDWFARLCNRPHREAPRALASIQLYVCCFRTADSNQTYFKLHQLRQHSQIYNNTKYTSTARASPIYIPKYRDCNSQSRNNSKVGENTTPAVTHGETDDVIKRAATLFLLFVICSRRT